MLGKTAGLCKIYKLYYGIQYPRLSLITAVSSLRDRYNLGTVHMDPSADILLLEEGLLHRCPYHKRIAFNGRMTKEKRIVKDLEGTTFA
jgi:hypothetical protein